MSTSARDNIPNIRLAFAAPSTPSRILFGRSRSMAEMSPHSSAASVFASPTSSVVSYANEEIILNDNLISHKEVAESPYGELSWSAPSLQYLKNQKSQDVSSEDGEYDDEQQRERDVVRIQAVDMLRQRLTYRRPWGRLEDTEELNERHADTGDTVTRSQTYPDVGNGWKGILSQEHDGNDKTPSEDVTSPNSIKSEKLVNDQPLPLNLVDLNSCSNVTIDSNISYPFVVLTDEDFMHDLSDSEEVISMDGVSHGNYWSILPSTVDMRLPTHSSYIHTEAKAYSKESAPLELDHNNVSTTLIDSRTEEWIKATPGKFVRDLSFIEEACLSIASSSFDFVVIVNERGVITNLLSPFSNSEVIGYPIASLISRNISSIVPSFQMSNWVGSATMKVKHPLHTYLLLTRKVKVRIRNNNESSACLDGDFVLNAREINRNQEGIQYLLCFRDDNLRLLATSGVHNTLGIVLDLANANRDAILVIDCLGFVRFVNDDAVKLFQWSSSEMVLRKLMDFIPVPGNGFVEGPDNSCSAQINNSDRFSFCVQYGPLINYVHDHNSILPNLVEKTVSCLKRGDQHFDGAIVIIATNHETYKYIVRVRDLSDEKLLSVRLGILSDELSKVQTRVDLIGNLLRNLGNDIRTPLTSLTGMADLAMMADNADDRLSYRNIIEQSVRSVLSKVDLMVDFNDLISCNIKLVSESFDIRDAVKNVIKSVNLEAKTKLLDIVVSIGSDVPYSVVGDGFRFSQCIMLLLRNAISFSNENSKIEIDVRVDGQCSSGSVQLIIAMIDQGIGISESAQKELFDVVKIATRAHERRFGGIGLGLAVVSRLVSLMKGRIWVESVLGKGSTFKFLVVFGTCEATDENSVVPSLMSDTDSVVMSESSSVPSTPTAGRVFKDFSILVVDDNSKNLVLVENMMNSWGFLFVRGCTDGFEALEAIRDSDGTLVEFKMAVIDYEMPKMDGVELIQNIRNMHVSSAKNLKIILMAKTVPGNINSIARNYKVDACFIKPLRPSSLKNLIRQVADPGKRKNIYKSGSRFIDSSSIVDLGSSFHPSTPSASLARAFTPPTKENYDMIEGSNSQSAPNDSIDQKITQDIGIEPCKFSSPTVTTDATAVIVDAAAISNGAIARSLTPDIQSSSSLPENYLRVLICDDDAYSQMLTSLVIKKSGHRCNIAHDGAQAVEMYSQSRYDAILMDLRMPVMNGFDATRMIRAKEESMGWKPTIIIGLSAQGTAEDVTKAKEVGMNDFLTKPVAPARLNACLAPAMNSSIEMLKNPIQSDRNASSPVIIGKNINSEQLEALVSFANTEISELADNAILPLSKENNCNNISASQFVTKNDAPNNNYEDTVSINKDYLLKEKNSFVTPGSSKVDCATGNTPPLSECFHMKPRHRPPTSLSEQSADRRDIIIVESNNDKDTDNKSCSYKPPPLYIRLLPLFAFFLAVIFVFARKLRSF